MTRVTAIMPVRNGEDYLDHAIAGVIDQSHEHLDLIVVDDGSTDSTPAVAARWADRSSRVKLLQTPTPLGSGAARNLGAAHASGEYVWFVDADDYWSTDLVARLVREAELSGADVVVCGALVCTPNGRLLHPLGVPKGPPVTGADSVTLLLAGELQGHTWNKLIRKSVLGRDPFPHLPTHQDLAGMFGILAAAGTVAFVDDVLYHYVRRPQSSLNRRDRDFGSLLVVAGNVRQLRCNGALRQVDDDQIQFFLYRHVVLELVRDYARLPADVRRNWRQSLAEARRLVTIREAVRLAASGRRATAVEVVLATRLTAFYAAAYRATRSIWQAADRWRRPRVHDHWLPDRPTGGI
jgi:glycosyltransferase involved in cell wall biosynthesis